jgi:spore coat protein U-like protein
MKRLTGFLIMAMAIALVALGGTATAADTQDTVDVTAVIYGTCTITAGTIDFGSLDPVAAPAVSGTVTSPTVTCPLAVNYTVAADNGLNYSAPDRRMYDTVVDYIPYSITYTAGPTAGSGAAQTISLTGDLAAGSYTGSAAGNYGDTLTFTVTW